MKRFFAIFTFLLSTQAFAVDVVKIMNFSCPVCRASESLDESIKDALVKSNGSFVPAPLPATDSSSARESVYYASRLQGPRIEALVRKSLYKGAQDMEMPLEDVAQTTAWLEDDLTAGPVAINWEQLVQDADSPQIASAIGRAARVALKAGAQKLPTYVVLKNNQVIGAFDPDSVGSSSLISLRDAVVKAIHQADQK